MTERTILPDALLTHAARWIQSGEYGEAIYTLRRFLSCPDSVWPDARCEAMLLLARCCLHEGSRTEAERWLLRACAETPQCPKPWLEAAAYYETLLPQAAAFFAARAAAAQG